MKKKKEKTSMEKAFHFWTSIINSKKEEDKKFFLAGCEWMINYWTKRMLDGK